MAGHIILGKHQCHFLDAKEKFVGMFGGVGNGKTMVGCLKILELATQIPNNLCLIGRLTYKELEDSTKEMFMTQLARCYPPEAYKHNISKNHVEFWNGSKVIFRHLDNKENLLGPNLGAFLIDQAEEVDEEAYLTLEGRLRRENTPVYKGLVVGNPKPLTWVFYKFGIDQIAEGEIISDIKYKGFHFHQHKNYHMITAPSTANAKNLPEDYISGLVASYSPEWVERFINGGWSVFEGAIFDISKISGYDTLPEMAIVVTGVDPAISKGKEACNTAIVTVGMGRDGYVYDLETIAGKWSFLETLDTITRVVSRQRPTYLAVEDTGYQAALVEACQSELSKHKNLVVENAKADRDKFRRAKSVSQIISRGLFKTNNKELLAEIGAFDADDKSPTRKDRVDALVHALHMIQKYGPSITPAVSPQERFKGMHPGAVFLQKSLEEEKATYFHGDSKKIIFDNSYVEDPRSADFY